jgi:hypothetical protein
LEGERRLTDLVEKERPAIGRLKAPLPGRHCAGECAAHVPEQLGFHQVLRDRPAVHDDERPFFAIGAPVYLTREELLARAGLAGDQHVDICCGDLFHPAKHLLKARTAADDVAKLLCI